MTSTSPPQTTPAPTAQDTLVLTNIANKTEMLKRIEQAYQLSNHVYERIGQIVDNVYDKRNAIEAFQGTDDFSTSEVDQIVQALNKALEMLDEELGWLSETR